MNLKFELKRNGFPSTIISVDVDDNGDIQSVSCGDSDLSKDLNYSTDFQDFVRDSFMGRICSNQINVSVHSYKIEQLAGLDLIFG